MDELLELLESLRQGHNFCDDPWYSCPLADGGCADDYVPKDICTCGADEHNARLDKAIALVKGMGDGPIGVGMLGLIISSAVAEEREECAKIADEWDGPNAEIANDIRARASQAKYNKV